MNSKNIQINKTLKVNTYIVKKIIFLTNTSVKILIYNNNGSQHINVYQKEEN